MKFILAFLALAGTAALAQEDAPCPLTSRLFEDWVEITEEAEELGWYEDGFVNIDAVSFPINKMPSA